MRALNGEDYTNLRALYSVQPWGAERDNLHTAMIMAQSANQQRTKQTDRVFQPHDFMIGYKKPNQDAERIAALREHIKQTQIRH